MTKTNTGKKLEAILVVDDEQEALRSLELILKLNGWPDVISCQDSRHVMSILEQHEVAAVLLDLSMPYISGNELLPLISSAYPNIPVIIVTGFNEVETAVHCIKSGAFDYMVKPVEESRLISGIRRAMELQELRRENARLRKQFYSDKLNHPEAFSSIITANRTMRMVFQYAEAIADTNQPVLITGETGTGKELIAQAIHTLSQRNGNFVPVNVAGLDDNLFSDTLFGHEKGAFTGAVGKRAGLVERAENGTLFLDEIGDLSTQTQVKLLRLLQEKEYFPLGQDEPRYTNARIIVATHQNLDVQQETGHFRKDLYYRLHHHHISLPPLRERTDDLPLLVEHFLDKASQALKKKKPTIPGELVTLLATYAFPGNIRELESMIFDAVSRHTSKVMSLDYFKEYLIRKGSIQKEHREETRSSTSLVFPDILPSLKDTSEALVDEAMKRANNNQTVAAQLIGISQQALNQRLKRRKAGS